jgi:lipopolysaccharide exporter
LRGLGEFLTFEFDRFLVGTLTGAQQTGLYSVGREISALPASEIVLPIGRALLPTLSRLNNQPERLRAAIEKAITATLIVAAPAALGFAVIAPEFVLLLFGAQWLEAVPLVAIFSIGAMLSGFRVTSANVFVVTGNLKSNAALSWIQASYVLTLFYPAYLMGGFTGIAWLYVSSGLLMSWLYAFLLLRNGLVASHSLWWGISRPLLSAVVMYFAVVATTPYLTDFPLMAILVSKIIIGGIVYSFSLLSLWAAMGRPNSSESTIIELSTDKVHAFLAKRRQT